VRGRPTLACAASTPTDIPPSAVGTIENVAALTNATHANDVIARVESFIAHLLWVRVGARIDDAKRGYLILIKVQELSARRAITTIAAMKMISWVSH
jgi:hypothetical protein